MIPTLLLAVLLSTQALPLHNNDVDAVSVTNGDSTLVVWTNEFGVYPMAFSIYVRLMDSPFDRNALRLDLGFDPHVATNGREYLVGWSRRGSRHYQQYLFLDNAVVQLVSAEGIPGSRKVLNMSQFGGVTDVAWNGTHWMVAYYVGVQAASRLVLLDPALNVVASADVGNGHVQLHRIDGRWWAFRSDTTATEAIEVRNDGSIERRFLTDPTNDVLPMITHGTRPLLLIQNQYNYGENKHDVDAIPFDPDHGFGSRRPFLTSASLNDVEELNGGSLLLIATSDFARNDVLFIDASGEIRSSSPLYAHPKMRHYASLGTSKNGPLFFDSSSAVDGWSLEGLDLHRFPMSGIAPVDPMAGELVSQKSLPQDRRRAARH